MRSESGQSVHHHQLGGLESDWHLGRREGESGNVRSEIGSDQSSERERSESEGKKDVLERNENCWSKVKVKLTSCHLCW